MSIREWQGYKNIRATVPGVIDQHRATVRVLSGQRPDVGGREQCYFQPGPTLRIATPEGQDFPRQEGQRGSDWWQ